MALRKERKAVWQPSLHDLLVTVAAPTQVWCGADGQIRPIGAHGVFHADVRVLSSAVVTVDGVEPRAGDGWRLRAGVTHSVGLVRQLDDRGADPTFRIDRRREVARRAGERDAPGRERRRDDDRDDRTGGD